ncbi:hypothetical protein AN958_03262 [Leucoagaricus sp. SymC.cos]|nr:hypothetical protein AN958_03262 [Leucoagaricus sp. SymC.cos]
MNQRGNVEVRYVRFPEGPPLTMQLERRRMASIVTRLFGRRGTAKIIFIEQFPGRGRRQILTLIVAFFPRAQRIVISFWRRWRRKTIIIVVVGNEVLFREELDPVGS